MFRPSIRPLARASRSSSSRLPLVATRLHHESSEVPEDVKKFLHDYPDNTDNPSLNANLKFYSNQIRCKPDDLYIDELHSKWKGDYQTLEHRHGFNQWLFPIQEHGVNPRSQPLQKHERDQMRADSKILQRVLTSYRLMLDFYGMELVNEETGLLKRSENFSERYKNLMRSTHNYLRISRMLKSLSELGHERMNAGFILFCLFEQSSNEQLNFGRLRDSMDRWWSNCIRNDEERAWLSDVVDQVRGGKLQFSEEMYTNALEARKSKGKLSLQADA
ncbi:hypothetical protein FRC03_007006 [Tulasnella sp. 419]|nr:hypothetical protein FRC02_010762 [Tulasnella sp. 418]KAG8960141.1 hypothetical protein FRC03_007006 [Tulasnella sp. 419]